MITEFPFTRDLVLMGGGHSHALVLRKWGMNPLAGVRLTVIDPAPTAAYSGMLPGFVAGHYGRDDLGIDLVRLARFAGARLILGPVTGLDPQARRITVPGRPPIAYDVAAIDVGITSQMPALPGFSDHAWPAKPLTPFAKAWNGFRLAGAPKDVAVIGGGVAGCELAMAMAHALSTDGAAYRVHLLDRSSVLTETAPDTRGKLMAAMADLGIVVLEDAAVAEVEAETVRLVDGRQIPSQFTVGAAGAKPHAWQAEIGLETTDGFLCVNPMLQTSDPAIFASGDCAHLTHAPRTKAGVFAVRQAPVLFDNVVAALSGGALRRYDPQKDYLKLISLGSKKALAEKWGRAVAGPLLWRWKDRIDQRFMTKLRDLPSMTATALPRRHAKGVPEALGDKPMCGGCGAKIGRGALREALADLPAPTRGDVGRLPGDDAATLHTGDVVQVMTTDHLRSVTDDPVLMTRIAALHALGDIWAMGAAPQAATVTLILPRMSSDLQRRTMAEVMATAQDVMAAAGADIVGGHSSMGSEMTIGFTVTGLCDRAPVTIAGARPGDTVILTKPLGIGVILAAEMQGKARGDVVAGCYAAMTQPQGTAAHILSEAHAMTDVTGFGLAGHLSGLAEASGVTVTIKTPEVRLLPGALDLARGGVASTLLADNRLGAGAVISPPGPLGDLMFDPQTAGGLLACVDTPKAQGILSELQSAGYDAAAIGTVTAGAAQVIFDEGQAP